MDVKLVRTSEGFRLCDDNDYEQARKLKIGKVYMCKVKLMRNYELHKKYFALINCAWAFLDEPVREFFNQSVEGFRKAVEISAGHYEQVYSIGRKEWLQIPKSVAFDKMSQEEFSNLYENVKNVLFAVFLKNVNKDEFLNELINF